MDSKPQTTRVGIVSFVNSWPLAWAFLTGRHASEIEPVFLRPSEVADRLARGDVDVGLIPSAELQRIPDLSVVPGLCVASDREVTSVLLVSKVPIESIRRVGLDTSSRTSAVLVQILLAARGVCAEFVPLEPDLGEMLRSNDAALLIGDPALKVDRSHYFVLDLASEWRRLTDLPFVFAVWAVRRGAETRQLVDSLRQSLELGLKELDLIVGEADEKMGLGRQPVRQYFTESLKYHLGDEELASLREFFERGARLGLLPKPKELRFTRRGVLTSSS